MKAAQLIAGGAVAVAALAVVAVGRGDPPTGKSGGSPSTSLELVVVGSPGDATSRIAERFERRVDTDSNGALDVSITYRPARFARTTPARELEATAIRALRDGRVQLGLVPSSAFEGHGVTSLRALQAPFRINSYLHAVRATTGSIATRLQAGLDGVSLTGLGLVPEGMKRPFGYLKPLLSPADFAGLEIAADPSPTTRDALRALGARPVATGDRTLDTTVRSGFARDLGAGATPQDTFPESAYTTANIALAPKVDAIVAGDHAFGELSNGQRAILRRAAAEARAETVSATNERSASAAYCKAGGALVEAPASSLRELRAKTAPVLAALRRDAGTRATIAAIDRLEPSQANSPPPCGPGAASSAPPPEDTTGFRTAVTLLPPVGSYRRVFTATEIRAAGASASDANRNDGVTTLTFMGPPFGRDFELAWRDASARPQCRGHLELTNRRILLHWNPETPCRGLVALSWRVDARGDLVVGVDPRSDPAWIRAVYPGTWRRVDCTPSTAAPVNREKHELWVRELDSLRTLALPENGARIRAARKLGPQGKAELADAKRERARIQSLIVLFERNIAYVPVVGAPGPGDRARPC